MSPEGCSFFNPFILVNCTLANSEDPDEMPHNAAFHLGLHCFAKIKRSSEK